VTGVAPQLYLLVGKHGTRGQCGTIKHWYQEFKTTLEHALGLWPMGLGGKWRCKWKNQNQKVIVKVEKNQNITFTKVNDHKITETKEHTKR
jgi:hypothetical protein